MNEIRIMPKPDWISWDEIQNCIYIAQQTNVKKGFDMIFGHYTGEELKNEIGDGYCFVALDQNNKVVGTLSLIVSSIKLWWHKGQAGLHCYEGILPEYRGSDVYFGLHDIIEEKEKKLGLKVIWATTAEQNKVIINLANKTGWKKVQFAALPKRGKYFSVMLAKWVDGCPHSDTCIRFMYKLSERLVRMKYKVTDNGKTNRFKLWK